MSAPELARVVLVGTIESLDRKTVGQNENARDLAEFRLEGLRLRINAWMDLAKAVPAVGSRVLVEGSIGDRGYTVNRGQPNEEQRTSTEIKASTVQSLDEAKPASPSLPTGGF